VSRSGEVVDCACTHCRLRSRTLPQHGAAAVLAAFSVRFGAQLSRFGVVRQRRGSGEATA
jgi:hypothetical protein